MNAAKPLDDIIRDTSANDAFWVEQQGIHRYLALCYDLITMEKKSCRPRKSKAFTLDAEMRDLKDRKLTVLSEQIGYIEDTLGTPRERDDLCVKRLIMHSNMLKAQGFICTQLSEYILELCMIILNVVEYEEQKRLLGNNIGQIRPIVQGARPPLANYQRVKNLFKDRPNFAIWLMIADHL